MSSKDMDVDFGLDCNFGIDSSFGRESVNQK